MQLITISCEQKFQVYQFSITNNNNSNNNNVLQEN